MIKCIIIPPHNDCVYEVLQRQRPTVRSRSDLRGKIIMIQLIQSLAGQKDQGRLPYASLPLSSFHLADTVEQFIFTLSYNRYILTPIVSVKNSHPPSSWGSSNSFHAPWNSSSVNCTDIFSMNCVMWPLRTPCVRPSASETFLLVIELFGYT